MFNLFKKKEELRELPTEPIVTSSIFNQYVDALKIPAVYKAINTISQSIASVKMRDEPLPLQKEPQENITRYNWVYTQVKNLLVYGNAYAEIKGKELIILDPKNISIVYNKDMNAILYYQHLEKKIYPENIIHFRGLSDNLGLIGTPIVTHFNRTFDQTVGIDNYSESYLKNSTKPSFWISFLKNVNNESLKQFKDDFRENYQGVSNSGKVPVLPNEVELKEISKSNTIVDADLNNLKNASLKDIANIFNMPVSMLDDSLSTYSNSVEANLSYLKLCINPLLTNIKEEINLKLNSNMSFDTSSLIEGSFEQKINTLTSAVSGGILTPNEARARLNYKTLNDGNKLYLPAGTPSTQKDLNNAS